MVGRRRDDGKTTEGRRQDDGGTTAGRRGDDGGTTAVAPSSRRRRAVVTPS